MSPLWCGPGSNHGFVLDGQPYWPNYVRRFRCDDDNTDLMYMRQGTSTSADTVVIAISNMAHLSVSRRCRPAALTISTARAFWEIKFFFTVGYILAI